MTVEEQLALVEGLARVMRDYRIDAVCVGDVKLAKSLHDSPEEPKKMPAVEDEDDVLFHSAGG